jgi:hypothetical protein
MSEYYENYDKFNGNGLVEHAKVNFVETGDKSIGDYSY